MKKERDTHTEREREKERESSVPEAKVRKAKITCQISDDMKEDILLTILGRVSQ